MHITVIGSGYVGLVTAVCLAEIGHQVIAVDSDAAKIRALSRGEVPFYESLLPELLQRHGGQRLRFSSHPHAAVAASDVIFLAVGTPQSDTGEADLSQVEAVAREIAPAIHRSTLIVEKSTVPVCTCDRLRGILLQAGARRGWFAVASNPEFLREGSAITDFLYPDRIVIGADDEFARELLREVYRPLVSGAYYRREDAVPRPDAGQARDALLVTSVQKRRIDQTRVERTSWPPRFPTSTRWPEWRRPWAPISRKCAPGWEQTHGSEGTSCGRAWDMADRVFPRMWRRLRRCRENAALTFRSCGK